MTIGKWIRACRQSAQLTQSQLGEALGVTKSNVSAWENGRHEPSYSQLLLIRELSRQRLPLPGLENDTWLLPNIDPHELSRLTSAEINEVQTTILAVLHVIEARRRANGADGRYFDSFLDGATMQTRLPRRSG